jgi:phage N-6-adenine-methyltransferase
MTKGFTSGMRSSLDDTWTTPKDFFASVNEEFDFGLDAAALSNSTLIPSNWYGPDHPDPIRRDALVRDWTSDAGGKPIWLNPPYGRVIGQWVKKANQEAQRGGIVVCLVPARTDTHWWHNYCIHHEVRFLRGRLKFGNSKNSAPFPSALVVMR